MHIRLKKGRDGPDSLACVREDGTSTWRRIQRGLAFHDLAHFAVETELAIGDGFYGLVASGWSFEDLMSAEERANIPSGAMWVELLVNAFLTEAMSGAMQEAGVFHDGVAQGAAKLGHPVPRRLSDEEIARIRGTIARLAGKWRALALGDTLELEFAAAQDARAPGRPDR
jgi:hypothetical protein